MAINIVRTPSDTPNITNNDDARALRFGFGNADGIIKNFGQDCDIDILGKKIQSGEIVLNGFQTKIDGEGVTLNIIALGTTYYYSVYCEINLTTNIASIKMKYANNDYPNVEIGDDLTTTPSGTRRLVLYHLKVNGGGYIINTIKVAPTIKYLDEQIEDINERLDALGFKEGAAIVNNETNPPISNTLKKQGKYVLFTFKEYSCSTKNCIIPEGFRPKENTTIICYLTSSQTGIQIAYELTVYTDGTISPITSKEWFVIKNSGWEIA